MIEYIEVESMKIKTDVLKREGRNRKREGGGGRVEGGEREILSKDTSFDRLILLVIIRRLMVFVYLYINIKYI